VINSFAGFVAGIRIFIQNKMKNTSETFSLDTIVEQCIGKIGTPKRNDFENKLKMELLGPAIRQARYRSAEESGN
jgi:hypothetical protein